MFCIELSGGTGNVLFQIASVLGRAIEYGHEFAFHCLPERVPKLAVLKNITQYYKETIPDERVSLSETNIDKLASQPLDQFVQLTGFFQDYRLFVKHQAAIFHWMGLNEMRRNSIQKVSPILLKSGITLGEEGHGVTISLHIRRGDYETASCYHLLLNSYYYKNAVLSIVSRYGTGTPIKIVAFYQKSAKLTSQKIVQEVEKTTLSLGYKVEYLHFNELTEGSDPIEDHEEMMVMSGFQHHIIANSTFSWWGAYLNPSSRKIVCYPNEFFNHQLYYISTQGLEVDGWIKTACWDPAEFKCKCYEDLHLYGYVRGWT